MAQVTSLLAATRATPGPGEATDSQGSAGLTGLSPLSVWGAVDGRSLNSEVSSQGGAQWSQFTGGRAQTWSCRGGAQAMAERGTAGLGLRCFSGTLPQHGADFVVSKAYWCEYLQCPMVPCVLRGVWSDPHSPLHTPLPSWMTSPGQLPGGGLGNPRDATAYRKAAGNVHQIQSRSIFFPSSSAAEARGETLPPHTPSGTRAFRNQLWMPTSCPSCPSSSSHSPVLHLGQHVDSFCLRQHTFTPLGSEGVHMQLSCAWRKHSEHNSLKAK